MTQYELPLLARQPILNRTLDIVAYELLCRPTPEDTKEWQDNYGDMATSEVLISAFHDIGIDHVTGGTPAYINFTPHWLHNPPAIPSNTLVAEILEYIDPTPQNLSAIQALQTKGYRIALDDYDGSTERAIFLPYVHIVKIDIKRLKSLHEIENIINKYSQFNITWLAEKVETKEEFDVCLKAGCSLFQGYFFSQPTLVYGKRIPDNELTVLQMLQVLNRTDVSINEVATVLKSEPQLSYKILKSINSASFRTTKEITSIHDAILRLGINRLRAWANVIALGKLNNKPYALREQAIVRGTLCKSLAFSWPELDEETAFTIGLFSLLPAFLDHSMEEILQKLNVSHAMNEALNHHSGNYGFILKTTIAMEKGDWNQIDWDLLKGLGVSASQLERYYLSALQYTQELLDNLSTT